MDKGNGDRTGLHDLAQAWAGMIPAADLRPDSMTPDNAPIARALQQGLTPSQVAAIWPDIGARLAAVDPENPGNGSGPPVKVWTLAELMAAEFTPPVWNVEGLLPAGLAVLGGRPKQGKSFLALQCALAVCSGALFLQRQVTTGPALYIAQEDSPRSLQKRLRDMHAEAPSAGLSIAFGWAPVNEPEGIDALADAIDRDGLRFIVLDTLARSVRGRVDWDEIGAVTAIFAELQRLAMSANVSVLLIDHHRKGQGVSGSPDVVDDIMGSTGKSAVADTLWGLYRTRGERSATLAVKGRELEDQSISITFDGLTRCWNADESPQGVRPQTAQARILELIDDWGSATTQELAEALDKSAAYVSHELAELLAKQAIVKAPKIGRRQPYTLPPQDMGL